MMIYSEQTACAGLQTKGCSVLWRLGMALSLFFYAEGVGRVELAEWSISG
jgi:hypothetical protein